MLGNVAKFHSRRPIPDFKELENEIDLKVLFREISLTQIQLICCLPWLEKSE